MKARKLISSVIIFLIFNTAQAQTTENALLWEVTGNGLSSPSYIFGILKFIPSEDYYFPTIAQSKFAKCKMLATETTLDHHARHELNKAAHLPSHKSLEDYLSEDEFADLKSIFSSQLGVPEYKFNLVYKKFKPVMISTAMTRLSYGENIRFYEFELINKANENKMELAALETTEREIEALEKLPLDDQVNSLKHSIRNFDSQLADYKALVQAYKIGDLHKSTEFTLHPIENHEDFEQHFIFDRNKEWVAKMKEYMKKNPTFFAIGVSHLSESEGIIALLKKNGYTVTGLK